MSNTMPKDTKYVAPLAEIPESAKLYAALAQDEKGVKRHLRDAIRTYGEKSPEADHHRAKLKEAQQRIENHSRRSEKATGA